MTSDFMTSARSLHQWLQWVPRVHPETGVQQVRGRWMAATPDDVLHSFEGPGGVSEVGERIIALVDGKRTVGEIAAVLQGEFDVSQAECEEQTVQFIQVLIEKKVLASR
jgi:hypothetical protein